MMTSKVFKLILALSVAAILPCGPAYAAADAPSPGQAPQPAAAEAQADGSSSGPEVLAVVNGREITGAMVDLIMDQVTAGKQQAPPPDMEKEILANLVELELIAQDAEKKGLENDAEFKVAMELFKKQQLYTAYLNKEIVETVKLGPDDAKAYYDANPDEFKTNQEVRASHILVETLEEAEKIKARIDAGEDFAELAKAESSCPSAPRGGDLGFFTAGKMVPEFENAAFALAKGDVSGPVKTQFGYHIIKVTDKKEAGVKGFDEVRPQIEQKLTFEMQQKRYDELTSALRENAKIEIFAQEPAGSPEDSAEGAVEGSVEEMDVEGAAGDDTAAAEAGDDAGEDAAGEADDDTDSGDDASE